MRNFKKIILIVSCVFLLSLIYSTIVFAATPPGQPASGPGGSNYTYTGYVWEKNGSAGTAYYLFEPTPKPENAPVICFLHGWSATNPFDNYILWIEHLVKKGNVVIYPVYQGSILTPQSAMLGYGTTGLKDAITHLQNGSEHVRPQIGSDGLMNFAIMGHSLGGNMTVAMAANYPGNGIPKPKAIMPTFYGADTANHDIWTYNETNIPSDTYFLSLCGNEDTTAGQQRSKDAINMTTQISNNRKDHVEFRSDYYGDPDLVANHSSPGCASNPNTLDYYGFWKLSTALTNYAFFGTDRSYCLDGGTDMTFMGNWSDGTPVNTLSVRDAPVS